jgi:hypothetical protein
MKQLIQAETVKSDKLSRLISVHTEDERKYYKRKASKGFLGSFGFKDRNRISLIDKHWERKLTTS